MKVKIFSKYEGYFSKLSKMSSHLELEINAWLKSHPGIKIIDITQSSCGGSLEPAKHIISIWYETEV
ncbi:MAG: hypothetical protein KAS49_06870 [Candidatus Cloacimonetes bacterium]|nr:hypothetical protein [Candidatus Cloacimonadota bacterium]